MSIYGGVRELVPSLSEPSFCRIFSPTDAQPLSEIFKNTFMYQVTRIYIYMYYGIPVCSYIHAYESSST